VSERPRRVALVSTGRSDYFLVRALARGCEANDLDTRLLACGGLFGTDGLASQVVEDFGNRAILLPTHVEGDFGGAFVRSASNCLFAVGQALEAVRPDAVLVLGDRFETLPAAFAAVQLGLPLIHVHGGEISEGAIDDAIRHSISKLAHVHFVSAELHAHRLMQMGEEPWRVHVTGAPGLDVFAERTPLASETLSERFGVPFGEDAALVTVHPETIGAFDGSAAVRAVRIALEAVGLRAILTAPNQDKGREPILAALRTWADESPNVAYVPMLGEYYPDALRAVGVVVGNSSSGLIEAASVPVPVLDLGERQAGRLKPPNVISAPFEPKAVEAAIHQARSPEFMTMVANMTNPYGDGHACRKAGRILAGLALDDRLLRKRFVEADCLPRISEQPHRSRT